MIVTVNTQKRWIVCSCQAEVASFSLPVADGQYGYCQHLYAPTLAPFFISFRFLFSPNLASSPYLFLLFVPINADIRW